jgi:transcriptional regulator with XRE-family HTH domain
LLVTLDAGRLGSGTILFLCGKGGKAVAERPVAFAGLLHQLRTGAGLTQEELAEAAGVAVRSIRYLERGSVASPQKETVRLLAGALGLAGAARAEFEAAARSGASPGGAAVPVRTLPRDTASFTGRERELTELMGAVAGAADAGGVVGIHAIGGMAGVGKTAFAVHAAHRLAGRFPGRSSCRCTGTPPGSSRSTRPTRWPACC